MIHRFFYVALGTSISSGSSSRGCWIRSAHISGCQYRCCSAWGGCCFCDTCCTIPNKIFTKIFFVMIGQFLMSINLSIFGSLSLFTFTCKWSYGIQTISIEMTIMSFIHTFVFIWARSTITFKTFQEGSNKSKK